MLHFCGSGPIWVIFVQRNDRDIGPVSCPDFNVPQLENIKNSTMPLKTILFFFWPLIPSPIFWMLDPGCYLYDVVLLCFMSHYFVLFVKADSIFHWLLVSEPGFLKVLGDLGRKFKFIFKLRPRSNIV